jgi:hypothetical protein
MICSVLRFSDHLISRRALSFGGVMNTVTGAASSAANTVSSAAKDAAAAAGSFTGGLATGAQGVLSGCECLKQPYTDAVLMCPVRIDDDLQLLLSLELHVCSRPRLILGINVLSAASSIDLNFTKELLAGDQVRLPIPGLTLQVPLIGSAGMVLLVNFTYSSVSTGTLLLSIGIDACAKLPVLGYQCGSKVAKQLPIELLQDWRLNTGELCTVHAGRTSFQTLGPRVLALKANSSLVLAGLKAPYIGLPQPVSSTASGQEEICTPGLLNQNGLSTFVTLIQSAGLLSSIVGAAAMTLFVPPAANVSMLLSSGYSAVQIQHILEFHLLPNVSVSLTDGADVATSTGQILRISVGGLLNKKTRVRNADGLVLAVVQTSIPVRS